MCILEKNLPPLLDADAKPDIVLYDAGVDVHERDMVHSFCRGHLSLTDDGLRRRDQYVLYESLKRNIPVATVIGGGYSRNLDELAQRHCIHAEVVHRMLDGRCLRADSLQR